MPESKTVQPVDWRTIVYNILLILLLPLEVLYLLWRLVLKGKSRAGLGQRLGFVAPEAAELGHHDDPVLWFQACSVGEVAAVDPILRKVREFEPLAHIVLSTTTRTGYETAKKRGFELDALIYFPFDFPFVVGRVLRAIRPDLLVMVETELWPNILATARRMGIKTAVINGRISDRAYPRDLAVKPLISWALSNFDTILVQSEKDAERFRTLGAAEDHVVVVGNSKFDEKLPEVSEAEAAKLRLELGLPEGCPVLVAGSTREGEEEKVLDAFDLLRQEHRDLQLVIAPRHIERGDTIERMVTERGFATYRRSRALATEGEVTEPEIGAQVRVVILDTLGELTKVYALATVVFVGGSLVPIGGHNILQPIAQGKPTLMGPYMHNQQDLADIALGEQAAETVRNPEELAQVTGRIVSSEAEQELFATRGRAMMERHGGASRRYLDRLVTLLHQAPQE